MVATVGVASQVSVRVGCACEHCTAAAERLGAIHRGVGALHQLFARTGVRREQRDADRHAEQIVALIGGDRLAHGLQHFGGDGLCGLCALDFGQQDDELVTADARHGVGVAHGEAQAVRDRRKHGVAHGMAVRIVDDLEIIEVQQH